MKHDVRILALVTDAYGAGGGIAQYNRDLIGALSSWPRTGSILVLPRLGVAPAGGLPAPTRQLLPIHNQVAYSFRALILALASRPDIVFCGHLYMAPLAALVARLVGARLVVQTHGTEVWPRPAPLQRWAVEAADLVLCVSRDTRARVRGWARIAPERVRVAPNTVGEAYSPGDGSAVRRQLAVEGKTVLLSISRLDLGQRYKGQDKIIERMARLRAGGRDLVYLIGGKGDDSAQLMALARSAGVADHVRLLGEVPYAGLPDLYRAADLYCMPSTGEGFGIVFLEAMACGTPALGLAVGGAPDALVEGLAVAESELDAALDQALGAPRPDPAALSARIRRRYGRPVFEASLWRIFDSLIASLEPDGFGRNRSKG